jgi:biofilm PGA synthesis N-glycosyltransferase PgaC
MFDRPPALRARDVEPPGAFRPSAARPLPPLRPIADFVGLPDGGRPVPVEQKLTIAGGAAVAWALVATVVAVATGGGLAGLVSWPYALALAVLTVSLPAALAAFRALGLFLDETPPVQHLRPVTPVTVLLTGDDADAALTTLASLASQDYDGPRRVVVATRDAAVARALAGAALERRVDCEVVPDPGGAPARNAALGRVATPLVLAVEPGITLHPSALRLLVARLESAPSDAVAVSAHTLVRNRDPGRLAEGLAAGWLLELDQTRRLEDLFVGPLAGSRPCLLVRAEALRAVRGWAADEDSDAELTWRVLECGWRVISEPLALVFRTEMVTVGTPARWRTAAARAVRDAARDAGGLQRLPRTSSRVLAGLDRFGPIVDVVFTLAWLQAVVLVGFGHPSLVLVHLLLVAPVSLGGAALERRRHREVLDDAALLLVAPSGVRVAALLALQAVQSPVAVWARLRTWPHRAGLGAPGAPVRPRRRLAAPVRPYA